MVSAAAVADAAAGGGSLVGRDLEGEGDAGGEEMEAVPAGIAIAARRRRGLGRRRHGKVVMRDAVTRSLVPPPASSAVNATRMVGSLTAADAATAGLTVSSPLR